MSRYIARIEEFFFFYGSKISDNFSNQNYTKPYGLYVNYSRFGLVRINSNDSLSVVANRQTRTKYETTKRRVRIWPCCALIGSDFVVHHRGLPHNVVRSFAERGDHHRWHNRCGQHVGTETVHFARRPGPSLPTIYDRNDGWRQHPVSDPVGRQVTKRYSRFFSWSLIIYTHRRPND